MLEKALSGEYIAAGESGLPDENGRNILPTGRNIFSMSIEKVPTKAAWQRGIELANQLLEQFTNDEGSIPEQVAMNMISIDITRASGEQLSEYLYLIGIRPVWDKLERVMGLEPIPLDELKRPRIDVTVRITGVLRDTWPTIALMMDDAAVMAASLQEPDSMNYLAKHVRQYSEEFGVSLQDAKRVIRIFGDAPGSYGAGLDLALLASAWKDEGDLVQYFTQASSYAYGNGLNGDRKIREFIDVAKKSRS
jgi:cobaltochelatase CobN